MLSYVQRAMERVSCNQLQLQVEFITVIVSRHNVLIAIIEQIVIIIIIIIRANIESSYGHKVSELRMQYTQEDKEVIEELKAKRSKSEILMEREDLSGNSINICSSP